MIPFLFPVRTSAFILVAEPFFLGARHTKVITRKIVNERRTISTVKVFYGRLDLLSDSYGKSRVSQKKTSEIVFLI